MTTRFEEPVNLNEYKNIDGWVVPDMSGKEYRRSHSKAIEDLKNLGCNIY
jgi:hypothetical protein